MKTGASPRLKDRLNPMINFVERHSASFSPNASVTFSDATWNDHIYPGTVR